MQRTWRNGLLLCICLPAVFLAGCSVIHPQRSAKPIAIGHKKPVQTESKAWEAGASAIVPVAKISFQPATLTLNELLDLTVRNNPELVIARAKANAARGQLLQAGLYPNPIIAPEIDNLGDRRHEVGEPGINFQQDIVTARKLQLDQAAASHAVTAADWQATTRWFDVVAKVRSAYFELLAAQRAEQATKDITRVAENSHATAQKLLKAGVGNRPDVLRAEVELDRARLNHAAAKLRVFAASRVLAAAIGIPELPAGEFGGDLNNPAPILVWDNLHQQMLAQSSEIQEAQAKVFQAEQLLFRAQVEKIPNIQLYLRHSYFLPDDQPLFLVGTRLAVPIFNRNQGNIQTAHANLAMAHAEVGRVTQSLSDRLAKAFERYQVALQQTASYRGRILPNARESVRLVQLGYQQGDPKYDYTALLQAQNTLFQAELSYVQSLGELWKGIAELDGLLQRRPAQNLP